VLPSSGSDNSRLKTLGSSQVVVNIDIQEALDFDQSRCGNRVFKEMLVIVSRQENRRLYLRTVYHFYIFCRTNVHLSDYKYGKENVWNE
jgi:hypothetical protein